MGDARYNMANSLMIGCAKMGLHYVVASPAEYFPDEALRGKCLSIAAETGATIEFEEDPVKAVQGADVVYTDIWVSMGEPEEIWAQRIHDLLPYQVNRELMAHTGENAVFMHCLPSFHDRKTGIGKRLGDIFGLDAFEVTDEVFESHRSLVFDEAENRMHTIKAVLQAVLQA